MICPFVGDDKLLIMYLVDLLYIQSIEIDSLQNLLKCINSNINV
ncbi:hypothetical protein EV06_1380 [Prochlorococcus sp. MIT 0602]|nr:hypothetical protein EV06_1380 [Prochlorococcus sp. MIT 0602]KGG17787.1 hypothetical protein EV07_1228 [Prochlorococcus sp. MIT 0603]